MKIKLLGASNTDYKTNYPPIMLGPKSGYKKVWLRRIEFTYTYKRIVKIFALENDMLWFKNNPTAANNYSISVPPGYYDSVRFVAALNRGLDGAVSLYNSSRRDSTGIVFSVGEGDKIVMKVVGEYVVLLASDISGVINNIGDTLGFNTKEQGTYAPDYDYGDGREEDKKDEKSHYFAGTYTAWNKMKSSNFNDIEWISVDCDIVNPHLNYIERRKGFLEQTSSLYTIDTKDISAGEKVDLHIPNVMYLPTRGDIEGISSFMITLTDQNENKLDAIKDVIATIEISK